MNKLFQGAESIVYQDNTKIIKERFSKEYRLPHLDESLRKFRTRREAKVLNKLNNLNFPAPKLHEFSDKRMSIVMDFVPGEKIKDILDENFPLLAKEMGERIANLHKHDIVHGDLTTSNMILHEETKKIHIIDFGLSMFSNKIEDKAVDLFLFERSLLSTHYQYPQIFQEVLASYQESMPEAKHILERLESVRKRGRNKK